MSDKIPVEFSPEEMLEQLQSFEGEGKAIMAEAYRKAAEIREFANSYAAAVLADMDAEDQKMLASLLYWKMKSYIRVTTISEAVGLSSYSHLNNWVYPVMQELTCRCGKVFQSPLSGRINTTPKYLECEECRKNYDMQYQREREERERTLQALRAMPYSEYLQTNHWQQVRLAALKRSKFRCQVCNADTKSLHVHHRTYENRGQELARDVIVLCADCHRIFHESGQLAVEPHNENLR